MNYRRALILDAIDDDVFAPATDIRVAPECGETIDIESTILSAILTLPLCLAM